MKSKTLLHSILFTGLVAAAPLALAQDAATAVDARAAAQGEVRADQIAAHYADVAGSTEAATAVVQQLQAGTAGAGAMAYGEVDIAMALAAELVESGAATRFDAAVDTVADLRGDGMGWGELAQDLGIDLGAAVSAAHRADVASQVAGSGALGAAVAHQARASAGTATDAVVDTAAGIAGDLRADAGRGAGIDASAGAGVRIGADARGTAPDRPARAEAGAGAGARIDAGAGVRVPVLLERPVRPVRGGGLL